MKNLKQQLFMIALIGFGCSACQPKQPQAPVANVIPHELREFGNVRIDNYHWMRLSDEQKNAPTPDAQTR